MRKNFAATNYKSIMNSINNLHDFGLLGNLQANKSYEETEMHQALDTHLIQMTIVLKGLSRLSLQV